MILPGDEGTFHQKMAWEPQEQKYTCQREKMQGIWRGRQLRQQQAREQNIRDAQAASLTVQQCLVTGALRTFVIKSSKDKSRPLV